MTVIGGRAVRLRNHENAFRGILRADHRVLRFRVQPDCSGEFAVIHPLAQHELVLVLDARVDEITEQPALDAVIGLRRIVDRPVRHAATDQPVGIVAAAGLALTGNRLAARIDAAHVRARQGSAVPSDRPNRRRSRIRNRSAARVQSHPAGYPCPATTPAERRCATGRKSWRRAVRDQSCPCSIAGNFRSPTTSVYDHLEDGEAAVQPEFARLGHDSSSRPHPARRIARARTAADDPADSAPARRESWSC